MTPPPMKVWIPKFICIDTRKKIFIMINHNVDVQWKCRGTKLRSIDMKDFFMGCFIIILWASWRKLPPVWLETSYSIWKDSIWDPKRFHIRNPRILYGDATYGVCEYQIHDYRHTADLCIGACRESRLRMFTSNDKLKSGTLIWFLESFGFFICLS